MKTTTFSLILLLILPVIARAQKINDWRPENRTGVSTETGLLKSWPADGPTLLWSNPELGKGYSSPSFGTSTIFITGLSGSDDILYALSMDGKIIWKTVMGRAWTGATPESRATPAVEGNRVYTCSGLGDLACIDWNTGKKMWEEKWNCKGSVISAEGMLYIYDERNGNVGLLKTNSEKFDLVSTFKVNMGDTGPFWAHPVIHNGILYLRHTNALMAYNIKTK